MKISPYEIIGIVATLFVFASYYQKDMRKLRFINLIGSVLFVVYGLCIHAWSTAILNVACFVMNMYRLSKKE